MRRPVVVGEVGTAIKPRRYVVCFNPKEAERDAAARVAILDSLVRKLEEGDKELVGDAGYKRFLKTRRGGHFEIDPARVAEDDHWAGLDPQPAAAIRRCCLGRPEVTHGGHGARTCRPAPGSTTGIKGIRRLRRI
jgi:hypothetical protein